MATETLSTVPDQDETPLRRSARQRQLQTCAEAPQHDPISAPVKPTQQSPSSTAQEVNGDTQPRRPRIFLKFNSLNTNAVTDSKSNKPDLSASISSNTSGVSNSSIIATAGSSPSRDKPSFTESAGPYHSETADTTAHTLLNARDALVNMRNQMVHSPPLVVDAPRSSNGTQPICHDPQVSDILQYALDLCRAHCANKRVALSNASTTEECRRLRTDVAAWEKDIRRVASVVHSPAFKPNVRIPKALRKLLSSLYQTMGEVINDHNNSRTRSTAGSTEPASLSTRPASVAQYTEATITGATAAVTAHRNNGSRGPPPPHQFVLHATGTAGQGSSHGAGKRKRACDEQSAPAKKQRASNTLAR